MTRGFDVGTAGLLLGSIALLICLWLLDGAIVQKQKIGKIERALRGLCSGEQKVEMCAKLDLPIK